MKISELYTHLVVLRKLMGDRKLNLNAPLLSVRRSTTPLCGVKEKKVENSQRSRQHTRSSSKVDSDLDQVTEPVAVPFHWEKIPGTAKDGRAPEASVTPRIPPGRSFSVVRRQEQRIYQDSNLHRPNMPVTKANSSTGRVGTGYLNDRSNEKSCLVSKSEEDDDDDDVFSDALETLSPTDSVSINCSANGLSSSDGLAGKPSGTFSVDLQTLDFMMRRFLPAAKAMTLETAHYASKRKPAPINTPKPIKTVIRQNTHPPVDQLVSINSPQHDQDIEEEEIEDECDKHEHSANKGCGLVPRLCFKNSLRIFNPIPGIKVRSQSCMSSTDHVEKSTNASHSRTHSPSPALKKHLRDDVYKPKAHSGVLSPRLQELENKLLAYGSNRFAFANEKQSMSRTSSPLRRSAGTSPFRSSGYVSPYRNEPPRSPFQAGKFLGIPKEAENLKAKKLSLYIRTRTRQQEQVTFGDSKRGSFSSGSTVEKTLYIDKVNKLTKSSGKISEVTGHIPSARNDFKSPSQSGELEETAGSEPPYQDAESLNKNKEERYPEITVITSASPSRHQDSREDLRQESKDFVCMNPNMIKNSCAYSNQVAEQDDVENSNKSLVPYHPLTSLLPKKPSESWLWHTIPSISSQNLSSKIYRGSSFQSRRQDSTTPSSNTKWETIVKSSYLHHDRVRYSVELVPHTSQQSKR